MPGLLGKKLGMSNIFAENGNRVPVTVIEVGPCVINRIKTLQKDGYQALQLGFGEKREKLVNKPVKGYNAKHNLPNSKVVKEFRFEDVNSFTVGQILDASFFKEGEAIKVRSKSKGKGFQGVMRRHGFGGVGGTTHGQSDRLRAPGSIGSSSYPSRVFKGQKMAGRMGYDYVTVRNLKVVKVVPEKNLILVKGSVPGHRNSFIELHKM